MKSFILFAAFAAFAILFGVAFEGHNNYPMAIFWFTAMVIVVALAMLNPTVKVKFQP